MPPGTLWRTADAVRFWFAVQNAMDALTDPPTPKARERVEEAFAMEDGRVLWERVFGPPTGACACTRTSGAETSTSSCVGSWANFNDRLAQQRDAHFRSKNEKALIEGKPQNPGWVTRAGMQRRF